jgi:GNAT superfamily N-acetyltransferase
MPSMPTPKLAIHPLTPARWPDLVKLFSPRGACAGCWCMWWRLPRGEFDAGTAGGGKGNRRGLERYVRQGHVPGLLAYDEGEPVGWVAVEPREVYPRLARSRLLAPVDGAPVWSITCFFVARAARGRGVTRALIEAAARHARARGGRIVEAYPVDLSSRTGDAVVYHGAASTFRALGFAEVARRSPTRPIVRLALRRSRGVSARRAPAARGRARGRSRPRSSPTRASAGPRGR